MKFLRIISLIFLLIYSSFRLFSEVPIQKYNLSGNIADAENGEALVGVTIYIHELHTGTVTNAYGFYSMNLPKGSYTIEYSYVGYVNQLRKTALDASQIVNIELKPETKQLTEVVVRAERKDVNVSRNAMSAQRIAIGEIRRIPALMGEVDVLKAIQMLPGVVSAGEGTSSFSVRGGAIDQNLIILDESTVYNASHLMGFFSVFNNDAIKNLTLYKGDIPAVYDGRLASLLDVNMKDGNTKKISGSGGIGTISSRLTIEGPISKDKTSFIVSARRTYADLFLKLSSDPAINQNQLFFYDVNAKFNYRFNANNHLFVSAYLGQDVFQNKNAGFSFGNRTFTGRWNHLFSKSLFSNLTLNYSRYTYGLGSSFEGESNFQWKYQMQDWGLKYDFTYFPSPDNTVKFGYQSTFHNLSPGSVTASGGQTSYEPYILPDNNAFEQAIYYQGEHQLSSNLSVKAGLRLNLFSNIGAGTVYRYDSDYKSIDSTIYGKGDIIKSFLRLAPRIGVNYRLTSTSSVKANYSRTNQFLQMATNSTAGTPLDLWFTSSPNVEPQTCDQFGIGYFKNLRENSIETSVELFYKKMNHTIDFKDHAMLLLNRKLDGELRFGTSNAYGVELLVQKKEGRATGWVSYTFSHSERKIAGVNYGETYVAPYDRPHTVYVVGGYDLSKRISIGMNFVYASGQPITYPVGRMQVGEVIVPVYSKRNEYRMPDYHRLDVSMTIKQSNKKHRPWDGEWNFSIYNVYAHKNPWAINFVGDIDNPNRTKAEMTYLFTFIPSITYNFKF